MEYNKAVDTLKAWADSYYNKGKILATDEEYDALYKTCLEYEKDNPTLIRHDSPTVNIGAILIKQSKFKKDKHIEKMYSLDNVFNIEEFRAWYDKIDVNETPPDMIAMHKYDGLSLNLYYENGLLVKAITRGDGLTGENVTINARQIKNIPIRISYLEPIEIRGEVLMTHHDFNKLNEIKSANGEDVFASPRNAAVGSLRNLNPSITRERNLIFMAWGLGYENLKQEDAFQASINSLKEHYDFISSLGFMVLYKHLVSVSEVLDYYNEIINIRDDLGYPIDGIVIKLNQLALIQGLGFTSKYPKWAIAFKLPPMERVSKLISIDNQVGKTGVVTPVANITPIDVDGVMVSKVTLHNYNEIKLKDLRVNDSIVVIRSGDVIPKITSILKDRREGSELEIMHPSECPVCQSELMSKGPNLYCTNDDCRAKVLGKLIHFVSRDGLNIDGMSESTIDSIMVMHESKYGKQFDFSYYIIAINELTIDDLTALEGFSIKKATNIYNAIQQSKTVELYKLIDSLSIPNIGTTASKAIVTKYVSLDQLLIADVDGLTSIDGIGLVQARSFVQWIKSYEEVLWKLAMFGYNIINTVANKVSLPLISATGKFPISRKNVIGIAGNYLGGDCEYTDKITKDVKLLVVGDSPSSKVDKARKLNIEIKTFEELING